MSICAPGESTGSRDGPFGPTVPIKHQEKITKGRPLSLSYLILNRLISRISLLVDGINLSIHDILTICQLELGYLGLGDKNLVCRTKIGLLMILGSFSIGVYREIIGNS